MVGALLKCFVLRRAKPKLTLNVSAQSNDKQCTIFEEKCYYFSFTHVAVLEHTISILSGKSTVMNLDSGSRLYLKQDVGYLSYSELS